MMSEKNNIAGLSMKGGRKDQFFFCLLEFYTDKNRWFLKSLTQVKDQSGISGDEAIRGWIESYDVRHMVVDFPLSSPPCHSCQLECPGLSLCHHENVEKVRGLIDDVQQKDKKWQTDNPKRYEQDRNSDDEFDFHRDIVDKSSNDYLMSRSFKRRLKKGYLPYWNRSLDLWIWFHYYDQLLELFNLSYDSFGNTSLMTQSRFVYLKKHFPQNLNLSESHVAMILIELLRGNIILKRDIVNIFDIEEGIEARLDIIKKIEKHLGLFIYDHDLEVLCKNLRAFDSFLLALSGQNNLMRKNHLLPDWALPEESAFIAPRFSLQDF
jgi:hypothetical protein